MKAFRRIFGFLPTHSELPVEEEIGPSRTYEPNTGFQPCSAGRWPRKSRHFPSCPTKLAATGIALGLIATSEAVVVSTVSIDFLGNSQSAALSSTDVAGLVPADQWAAASGVFGTLTHPDTLGGDTVDVLWNAPASGTIAGNAPTPGDNLMMEGYIGSWGSSFPTTPVPVAIRVSSIDLAALGWSSYDVIVYSDSGTFNFGSQINLSNPGIYSYLHNELPTAFGVAGFNTYLDSQTNVVGLGTMGNYVRYNGLTSNSFDLEISPLPGIPDIVAINGFQIIGQSIPEPSTSVLTIICTGLFLSRRKRC